MKLDKRGKWLERERTKDPYGVCGQGCCILALTLVSVHHSLINICQNKQKHHGNGVTIVVHPFTKDM